MNPSQAPADTPPIPADAVLWRRIPDFPPFVVPDQNRGGRRVSSAAFADDAQGLSTSVYLADVVGDPHRLLQGRNRGFALVAITAERARACGMEVLRVDPKDPDPDADPAHVYIVGKKTGRVKNCLLAAAGPVVWPPGWEDVSLSPGLGGCLPLAKMSAVAKSRPSTCRGSPANVSSDCLS
jgi:hypothetical protein